MWPCMPHPEEQTHEDEGIGDKGIDTGVSNYGRVEEEEHQRSAHKMG
jgi:hypothetical protein